VGTATYDIDLTFPKTYTITVPRPPEEIGAMGEEEFWALKAELDREYENYKQQVPFGPWDSLREGATKRILRDFLGKFPAVSCEERAEYLAKLFELIVRRRNLEGCVNIKVEAKERIYRARSHAWVEVEMKYITKTGVVRVVKGKFDPWWKKDVKWLWEEKG